LVLYRHPPPLSMNSLNSTTPIDFRGYTPIPDVHRRRPSPFLASGVSGLPSPSLNPGLPPPVLALKSLFSLKFVGNTLHKRMYESMGFE